MPQPIRDNILFTDLSARFQSTQTVAASPSAGTETTIATLTLANFNDIALVSGIRLEGWAAFTVGTNGVTANLKIRQTSSSGTTVVASGATTVTAANLLEMSVKGLDAIPGVGVYVLTLLIGSGSAASTVSACDLRAILI